MRFEIVVEWREPPAGRVVTDNASVTFTGWLDLLRILSDALADLGVGQAFGGETGDLELGRRQALPSGALAAVGDPRPASDAEAAPRRLSAGQVASGAVAAVQFGCLRQQRRRLHEPIPTGDVARQLSDGFV